MVIVTGEMVTTYWDLPSWGGSGSGARFVPTRYYSKDKSVGGFTTLSDGSKFRLSTNYSHFDCKIVGSGGQDTTTHLGPNTYHIWCDPPGIRSDLIFTNMVINSNIGAQNSTTGGPDFPALMQNEAATKALNKIADQKVNLAENLATAGQTARMFAGASKNLADFLQSVYRDRSMRPYLLKSWRQISREGVPKSISDKYLEYVYGWKPLMQDVFSLSKLLKDHSARSLLLHGEGKARRTEPTKSSGFYAGSYNYGAYLDQGEEDATVRCSIWAQIDPNWTGARALNQLGLLNPLSLVWEIMPWSFVVDWMVPIGPVLSALTAPAGLNFLDGSLSVKTKTKIPYRTEEYAFWYDIEKHTPNTGDLIIKGYTRHTLGNWPLPGIWFDPDPFRGDRIFKAAALAISNTKGMRMNIR